MKCILFACLLTLLMPATRVSAQSDVIDKSTTVLCLAPAATGLIKAVVEDDRQGLLQLGMSTITGIALNYGLNACLPKDRPEMPVSPDWGDQHAFPSTHTMAAFDGATFLMRRYGWRWGVPAYMVSAYVAWGRVHTDRHDWWDVLGGAVVGAGSALIYTRPLLKDADLTIAPVAYGERGGGLYIALNF